MIRKKFAMALAGLDVMGLIAGCGLGLMFGYTQKKLRLPSNFCVKQQEFPADPFTEHTYFTYTRKYAAYIQ